MILKICGADSSETERTEAATASTHMSHSLNSLKGGYIGDYIRDQYRGYGGY